MRVQQAHLEAPLALRLENARTEERAWIEAARRGDTRAQALLAEQWSGTIYRFAVRLLGNEQDALDASQDALVKVLRNLDRYDAERRFSTWVFGITRNTCIDIMRRRRRHGELPEREVADRSPSPFDLTERERRARCLETALAELPPRYREVLVLYHFEQLKYREIAELLDEPIGTIMNRIFRAREKLRERYDIQQLGGAA